MTFYFFALAALGEGLSGGDRIFIEFARRWSKDHLIHIYVWREGHRIIRAQKLKSPNVRIHIINLFFLPKLGFLINYLARIIAGIYLGFTLRPPLNAYMYSASDFWMDVTPALILKWRFPTLVWLSGWYQTAPSPFSQTASPFYWLSQLIIKPFITRWADFILVNNTDELRRFPTRMPKSLIVVLGAIDLPAIQSYIASRPRAKKEFAAVFQGRFHPQKGVLELLDIWKLVVQKLSDAKLAMIGDGELMPEVIHKIAKLDLNQNIKLFGYVYDGAKKYSIFYSGKIVVHPALYDSGGMAAAEAMAFGLPAVGFDLKSYESYYPTGMTKVPLGDLPSFASAIAKLLTDPKLYSQQSQTALSVARSDWSWDTRARQVLKHVTS